MVFDYLLNRPIDHRHKINDIQGLSEKLEQQNSVGALNLVISTTYSELKSLRDNNNLTPGVFYRIVDYTTTVANDSEARSAGHLFDIVVLAISSNVLSEEALAVKSIRDTDGYFSNANLSAWKIWYCLDNDIYRFTWADIQLGTGVIYRMIDEWGNDCPYDFKNVQFKRYIVSDDSANGELEHLNGTYIGINAEMYGLIIEDVDDYTWAYTFSLGDRTQNSLIDMSMIGFNSPDIGSGYGFKGYYGNNIIRPCSCSQAIDDIECSAFCLNNIVWFSNNNRYRSISGTTIEAECCNMTLSGNGTKIGYDNQSIIMGDACFQNIIESGCCLITFGQNCYDMQFGQGCDSMQFGQYCNNMQFGQDCGWLTFGQDWRWLTFGQDCGGMQFGQGCWYMQFGQNCYDMQFGQDCRWLTFGQGCHMMQFGQDCGWLTFGQGCDSMQFGQGCYNMQFGQNCYDMQFGQYCNHMQFGQNCYDMQFGQGCYNMQFGQGCDSMQFGQDCGGMQFGQGCWYMQFGQDCRWLTFGQGCDSMQFGQYCNNMQFGQGCHMMQFGQGCGLLTFGQNVRYIIFDNNIYNIEIPNNEDSSYVQNAHIFNGVHGNDSVNKLVINLAYNVEYTQFVAMKSDGSVRIWNPADVA